MKHRFILCLSGLCSVPVAFVPAQSGPAPKTYTYLIYHKLAPGLTIQDALSVEREWRAINQPAVDEGNLIGWHMMVRQMSSNPNPGEYDRTGGPVRNLHCLPRNGHQGCLARGHDQTLRRQRADPPGRPPETRPADGPRGEV